MNRSQSAALFAANRRLIPGGAGLAQPQGRAGNRLRPRPGRPRLGRRRQPLHRLPCRLRPVPARPCRPRRRCRRPPGARRRLDADGLRHHALGRARGRAVPALRADARPVQITCTGSEATYHALRLARAFTGRDHIVVMQGGYNGWHDEVACNVMTPLEQIGPRVSRGEYPFVPLSAGMPSARRRRASTSSTSTTWMRSNGPSRSTRRLPDDRADPAEHRHRQAAARLPGRACASSATATAWCWSSTR